MARTSTFPTAVTFLTEAEEAHLVEAWRHDGLTAARDELVARHRPLANKMIKAYRRFSLPLEDLRSHAEIGLLLAAKAFDPARGARFCTCAAFWIRKELDDYVIRNITAVSLGSSDAVGKVVRQLTAIRSRMEQDLGGALTPRSTEQIAAQLSVEARQLTAITSAIEGVVYLDSPSGPGATDAVGTRLPAATVDPSHVTAPLDASDRARVIGKAVAGLDARSQHVIRQRFLADEPATLQVVGQELGLSDERVRQLEKAALKAFRSLFESQGLTWSILAPG